MNNTEDVRLSKTRYRRTKQISVTMKMERGRQNGFIIAKTRKKKDFHKRFKKAEIQLKDLEESSDG